MQFILALFLALALCFLSEAKPPLMLRGFKTSCNVCARACASPLLTTTSFGVNCIQCARFCPRVRRLMEISGDDEAAELDLVVQEMGDLSYSYDSYSSSSGRRGTRRVRGCFVHSRSRSRFGGSLTVGQRAERSAPMSGCCRYAVPGKH